MRLDHPIFQGPWDPELQFGELPRPEHYAMWPGWEDLPETLTTWQVQTGERGVDVDAGLVSFPYGFEDSPDTELISSGVNSKTGHAAALARHGNLFLWGFSGSPKWMTESGRRVFLNTLVYMSGFDGQRPLFAPSHRDRQSGLIIIEWVDTYRRNGSLKRLFSAEILEEAGPDKERMQAWFADNVEYLYREGEEFPRVDPDLKALGISNRKPEFFETVLARWTANPLDAASRRLVDRYVDPGISGPEALAAYLEQTEGRRYFTDTGGYRWRVVPEDFAGSGAQEGKPDCLLDGQESEAPLDPSVRRLMALTIDMLTHGDAWTCAEVGWKPASYVLTRIEDHTRLSHPFTDEEFDAWVGRQVKNGLPHLWDEKLVWEMMRQEGRQSMPTAALPSRWDASLVDAAVAQRVQPVKEHCLCPGGTRRDFALQEVPDVGRILVSPPVISPGFRDLLFCISVKERVRGDSQFQRVYVVFAEEFAGHWEIRDIGMVGIVTGDY